MDDAQFYTLLGYVRSIRRLLIYILAALFGILCFAINKFGHPPWWWVLSYPAIFIFIAIVEIRIARKKQAELNQETPAPPVQSPVKKKR